MASKRNGLLSSFHTMLCVSLLSADRSIHNLITRYINTLWSHHEELCWFLCSHYPGTPPRECFSIVLRLDDVSISQRILSSAFLATYSAIPVLFCCVCKWLDSNQASYYCVTCEELHHSATWIDMKERLRNTNEAINPLKFFAKLRWSRVWPILMFVS